MMQRKIKYILLVVTIIIYSCATKYEVVIPYKNLGYSGERLFPVKTNYSEFTFRVWISNSTSIDRIISISNDSAGSFQSNLIEFGIIFHGNKYKQYYNDI